MLNLRVATVQDLETLEYWDKQQHVIDSDPDDDWNWAFELTRFPKWRQQLMAEIDGRPIGFIQIIDPAEEDSHYWGNVPQNYRAIDIWIGEKHDLGKGHGGEIMRMAIEICFENRLVKNILIDPLASNKDAIRFYERIGFQFVEERSFGESDCLVYQLTRQHWQVLTKRNKSKE